MDSADTQELPRDTDEVWPIYDEAMTAALTPDQQIQTLREELRHYEHLYYVLDAPELTDAQYDGLMERLKALEREHPELVTADSPSQRVGGKPRDGFAKTGALAGDAVAGQCIFGSGSAGLGTPGCEAACRAQRSCGMCAS